MVKDYKIGFAHGIYIYSVKERFLIRLRWAKGSLHNVITMDHIPNWLNRPIHKSKPATFGEILNNIDSKCLAEMLTSKFITNVFIQIIRKELCQE